MIPTISDSGIAPDMQMDTTTEEQKLPGSDPHPSEDAPVSNALHSELPGQAKGIEAPGPSQSSPSFRQVVSLHGHSKSVSALAFSPDGTRLASAGSDRVVQIWSLPTGSLMFSLRGHTQGISDVAWSPDATYVASASDDKLVKVWNARTGALVRTLTGHMSWLLCVAFNPQGTLLASGGYDETLRLWDLMRGVCLKAINAHTEAVTSVDFSADGAMAATGSYDGLVRLWNVMTGQCLKTLVPQTGPMMATVATPVASVKFAPSSSFLLASTLDHSVRLWDVINGKIVKTYTGHLNERYPTKAVFTPPRWPKVKGTLPPETRRSMEQRRRQRHNLPEILVVCGAEDQKVWIWDLQTKENLQTLYGHTDVILAIAVHPTLPIIASGSMEHDPSIRIWMDTSDDL